jgi:hypothetical protein
MRAVTLTIEGETEMFPKLTTVLPIAILLGPASAPALAQTVSHHVVQEAPGPSSCSPMVMACPDAAGRSHS